MPYFAAAAVLTALFRRRSLGSLLRVRFRHPFLLLGALVAQLGLWMCAVSGIDLPRGLFLATFALVIFGLWSNRHLPGIAWILAGTCANFVVLLANGGAMPVSLPALKWAGDTIQPGLWQDGRHIPMVASHLWWLGDWIPTLRYVLSPGDVLAGIGFIRFVHGNAAVRDAAC